MRRMRKEAEETPWRRRRRPPGGGEPAGEGPVGNEGAAGDCDTCAACDRLDVVTVFLQRWQKRALLRGWGNVEPTGG